MPFKSSPAVRTVFLEQSRSQADNPPFIAWTLNAEFGVLSSLPPGRRDWPISHQDRIRLVYNRVLDAAQKLLSSLNMSFRAPALTLVISPQPVINAFAKPDGTVQINLALCELISDSPSELAFAVAHELGHIVQFNNAGASILIPTNSEQDADAWALFFACLPGSMLTPPPGPLPSSIWP